MLTLLGFLALFQMTALPGYLILLKPIHKASTDKQSWSFIQITSYTFGLSLLANYFMVIFLATIHCYTAVAVYGVAAVELLVLLVLGRRHSERITVRITEPAIAITENLHRKHHRFFGKVLFAASLFLMVGFAWIACTAFGGTFSSWDDVVSWNSWAVQWSKGSLIFEGIYPQLLPVNWSLTYVAMQNSDVQLFAKAIMPLFPLFSVLLCWDLFSRTRDWSWLFALFFLSGIFLTLYFAMLTAGYVDLAAAFYCFLAIHSFFDYERQKDGRSPLWTLAFACGAALTKATGWFLVALVLLWIAKQFFLLRQHRTVTAISALCLVAATSAYYVCQFFITGTPFSYLGYLVHDNHNGRSLIERWQSASHQLANTPDASVQPLFYFCLLAIALGSVRGRNKYIALLIAAPIYFIWAIGFSYDLRALSIGLPFIAYLAGSGILTADHAVTRLMNRFCAKQCRYHALVTATAAGLILVISVAFFGASRSFKSSLLSICVIPFLPFQHWVLAGTAAVFSAAIFMLGGRRLQLDISGKFALPALAALLLVVQSTVMKPEDVVAQQLAQQRKIMLPDLNSRLYALKDQGRLPAKICTSYLPLKFLPDLRECYVEEPVDLTQPITAATLDRVSAQLPASLLLAPQLSYTQDADAWLKRHNCEIIFEQNFYRLVTLPPAAHKEQSVARRATEI